MSIFLTRRETLALTLTAVACPASAQGLPPAQGRLMPVRDTRLWVEDYGPRDAPALLYIHGGPGLGVFEFSHYMRGLLSREIRLILVDQRGVLRSDPLSSAETVTLDILVDDFEALRGGLGVKSWSVLGHSWGGPIALRYANRHRDTIGKVIFENAVLDTDATARNLLGHTAAALDRAGKGRDAASLRRAVAKANTPGLWALMDDALNKLPSRQSLYVYDPAFLGYYGRISADSGIPDERWNQGVEMAMDLLADPAALAPAWNAMSALSQPTLLTRGETDPSMSEREMSVMTGKPNVQLITVRRAGHFVHVERPDVFAAAVTRFLLS